MSKAAGGRVAKLERKDLEKMIMMADAALCVATGPPGELKVESARLFSRLHFYFAHLTLRALEDRELAELLIKTFEEAETYTITYHNALGTLSDLLRYKHKIPGKMPMPCDERLDQKMLSWARGLPYDEIKRRHEARLKMESPKTEKQPKESNVMYL